MASESTGIGAPRHPVPSMRSAFEESVAESDEGRRSSGVAFSSSRRRRPRHHWLRKLVAQIAFGLYLLHDGLARSDAAVVRILQGHINDMDHFLSTTTSDIAHATDDITARLQHLRIPLGEDGGVADCFDRMLESREFRREMMDRNEKVDFVVQKTTGSLQSALRDVREGLGAVDDLAKYLLDLKDGWRKLNLVRVYAAMTHNCELWFRCCVGLQMKGARLGEKLNGLQMVVNEIERRTAQASRKYKSAIVIKPSNNEPTSSASTNHHRTRSSTASRPRISLDKPLPEPPKPRPVITSIDIEIPTRTSSRNHSSTLPPARRLSKRRSRSTPHITTPPPEPAPPLPSQQPQQKKLKRSISQKFRQSFRTSKSMGELRKAVLGAAAVVDKGKGKEVVENGNGNGGLHTVQEVEQESGVGLWSHQQQPVHAQVKRVTGGGGGRLLRRISTMVLRRPPRGEQTRRASMDLV